VNYEQVLRDASAIESAGSTGLNLQAADTVVNVDLPCAR
jgi:hypothetical protein